MFKGLDASRLSILRHPSSNRIVGPSDHVPERSILKLLRRFWRQLSHFLRILLAVFHVIVSLGGIPRHTTSNQAKSRTSNEGTSYRFRISIRRFVELLCAEHLSLGHRASFFWLHLHRLHEVVEISVTASRDGVQTVLGNLKFCMRLWFGELHVLHEVFYLLQDRRTLGLLLDTGVDGHRRKVFHVELRHGSCRADFSKDVNTVGLSLQCLFESLPRRVQLTGFLESISN
mmetsp:Transcript_34010/g.106573  ORF Transcript_34010/g.106573 Transcript_34010/m.106573 type:complete len:230 (-) Transcript_34010:142-831(-)